MDGAGSFTPMYSFEDDMKEIIEIRNNAELGEATALLLSMGYRKVADSYYSIDFEKDGGAIILHMNYKE